jgi:hypothetical protein
MPVLVLASSDDLELARFLCARLVKDGGEVRCYLEEDDYELRDLGCKIAVGRLDDDANLEGSLTNVHTFIPLLPDPAGLRDEAALAWFRDVGTGAAAAAGSSNIEQTVLALPAVSHLANPLGQAFKEIEEVFVERCRPLCLIRTGLLWGAQRPFTAGIRVLGRRGALPGDGTARISVLTEEDFASVVSAADEREGIDGQWEFGGAVHTLTELAEFAGIDGVSVELSELMIELLTEGLVLSSSAGQEFGVATRPLIVA